MTPLPPSAARSDEIVIVGAGLGGLSAGLRLTGAGRPVTILEAGSEPGGLMGQRRIAGYRFDTGPTVLTMPELIDDALACVGESRADWLRLNRLDPSYRAEFADGSVLRSFADPARMAEEVRAVCGPGEVAGYERLIARLAQIYRAEFAAYMDRNLDRFRDLVRPEALALLRLGGLRSLNHLVGSFVSDDRLRRLFTFQALYAGLAPARARALYGVIPYLDSVAGIWFPEGGMHRVAQALAGAGQAHGLTIRYHCRVERVEINNDRAQAVITADGERIPAGTVILNTDLGHAYRDLLPAMKPPRSRRRRYSPSAVVLHIGSRGAIGHGDHHTLSFGRAWKATFAEIIDGGQLMSDPSLLISQPTVTDPSGAPRGRHTYYVLAPCPNTQRGSLDWPRIAPAYQEELINTLARRGFDVHGAFTSGLEVTSRETPADWANMGLSAGTPFALAHTISQTGPLRHPTQHPHVANLLFCGAGVQPGVGIPTVLLSGKLAAERVIGR